MRLFGPKTGEEGLKLILLESMNMLGVGVKVKTFCLTQIRFSKKEN